MRRPASARGRHAAIAKAARAVPHGALACNAAPRCPSPGCCRRGGEGGVGQRLPGHHAHAAHTGAGRRRHAAGEPGGRVWSGLEVVAHGRGKEALAPGSQALAAQSTWCCWGVWLLVGLEATAACPLPCRRCTLAGCGTSRPTAASTSGARRAAARSSGRPPTPTRCAPLAAPVSCGAARGPAAGAPAVPGVAPTAGCCSGASCRTALHPLCPHPTPHHSPPQPNALTPAQRPLQHNTHAPTPQVAIALSGGEVVYFEVDPQGQLLEMDKRDLQEDVACMDIAPVPEGRQRCRCGPARGPRSRPPSSAMQPRLPEMALSWRRRAPPGPARARAPLAAAAGSWRWGCTTTRCACSAWTRARCCSRWRCRPSRAHRRA
jgi:hypothetical protein